MTENKLTLEDCFKYYKATIIYEQEKFFGIGDFFRCSNPTLNISDCQLILRNISQLTDDEKIYINDNLFYGLFKNTVSLNANAIWNSFDELLAVCEDKTALIDYLRGNNIMIEKPDWFAIGKAVKDENR